MGKAWRSPSAPWWPSWAGPRSLTRSGVINNLLQKADTILIGGGMAYTFQVALGRSIGTSMLDAGHVNYARDMIQKARTWGSPSCCPRTTWPPRTSPPMPSRFWWRWTSSPENLMGMDIGPKTIESFTAAIQGLAPWCGTGPWGSLSSPAFAKGTNAIAGAMAQQKDAITIVGGGDSASAVEQSGMADQFTHISTGGGASWNFWKGSPSPVSLVWKINNRGRGADEQKYRKTIVAGNWKMHKTATETKLFAERLKGALPRVKRCSIVLCVPYVDIPAAVKILKDSRVAVGAQNLHWETSGPYTGKSPRRHAGRPGCQIRHHRPQRTPGPVWGDRPHHQQKLHAALDAGLRPILCVGRTWSSRSWGHLGFISYQLKAALVDVTPEEMRRVVIAYEPIWAIGTGNTATPEQAGEVCAAIRGVLRKLYGARIARSTTIQYGGSMNAANAQDLLNQEDVDGGLIGTAALDVEQFLQIIQTANQDGPQP